MRKKTIFLMMALALASTPAMLAQEAADTTFVFKDIKVNPVSYTHLTLPTTPYV